MASVPCNGCTSCCKGEALILHPENGDKPEEYLTMEIVNPLNGRKALALQHKPNGDCIYLGEAGCTIHGRAPVICREFDCRRFVQKLGSRHERRKLLALNLVTKDVVQAGLDRMGTLP